MYSLEERLLMVGKHGIISFVLVICCLVLGVNSGTKFVDIVGINDRCYYSVIKWVGSNLITFTYTDHSTGIVGFRVSRFSTSRTRIQNSSTICGLGS